MTTTEDPAIAAALIDWVNTFDLSRESITSLAELYDGTVTSLILHDIDPKYFGDGILNRNGTETVNWVQHFNVLKKQVRNMTDYYGDVLGTHPPSLPSDEMPNLSSIAKLQSIPDLVKFLRLVLAVAVKSSKKEEYVQTIYTLSPEAQKALMYLLQQVVTQPSGYSPGGGILSDDDQIRFEQEIAEISADRDAIEKAHIALMDDHEKLKTETARLQMSLEAAESRARDAEEAARSLGSKADSYLRSELDRLQVELQDVEAKSMKKDTLLESRAVRITNLTRQLDEVGPRAEQAARFEEEMKEASTELAQAHKKVARLENIVEKYKVKAEESNALLRQNEILEDENAQLKESRRKGDGGKADINRFDAMIALERASSEEKRKLQLEVDRLKEQLKTAEGQTSRDANIIATLEERVKDSGNTGPQDLDDMEGEDLNDEINTSRKDLRLQVARLEKELAGAKAEAQFNSSMSDNDGTPGPDDLRERFVKYETELSAANRKIADLTLINSQSKSGNITELQSRVEQLTQQLSTAEEDKRALAKEKEDLQQQFMQQKDRMLETERDAGRLKSSLAAKEGEAGGQAKGESIQLQKSIRDLTTDVKLKDADIQKLRDLVKKQDQKLKEGKAKLAKATAGADQALRDDNAELTKQLNLSKKSHREEVALKNKELQMMASAFHDLGSRTQLNTFVVEKHSHAPASFLAQQRSSIPSLSKKD